MAEPPYYAAVSAGMQSAAHSYHSVASSSKQVPSQSESTGSPSKGAGSKKPHIFPSSASSTYIMFPGAKRPYIQFYGDILIVTEATQAEEAISALMDSGAAHYGVGVDMEWQPTWDKNQPKSPTALIQVATGSQKRKKKTEHFFPPLYLFFSYSFPQLS
jgi:hypothetical protein